MKAYNNSTIERSVELFRNIEGDDKLLFESMSLPKNSIIVELFLKADSQLDENGLIVSENTLTFETPDKNFITIPNPTIHQPRGIVVKVSEGCIYKVGDIVEFPSEYVYISHQDMAMMYMRKSEDSDIPDMSLSFKLAHGYWLNPDERYKTQTNYIQIGEFNVTNYWRLDVLQAAQ